MKINTTLYRALLFSSLALLSFDQQASMEDVINAGQALQQDLNSLKRDVDIIKSQMS